MASQTALPSTLAPRLVTREGAAAYISVSPTLFDRMVQDGIMPAPKRLTDRRKAWDVRQLDEAVDRLPTIDAQAAADETWSDVDASQAATSR